MDQKVSQLIDKVSNAIGTAAPNVWEAAVQNQFYSCLAELISGALCLVVTISLALTAIRLFKVMDKASYDGEFFYVAGIASCAVVAVLTSSFALMSLLYPWNWIGLFNPKAALVHEIIHKLLSVS
jgi:hypothetical protein